MSSWRYFSTDANNNIKVILGSGSWLRGPLLLIQNWQWSFFIGPLPAVQVCKIRGRYEFSDICGT